MVSGFFGLFLICCCRKPYPGMRQSCCVYVVRLHYIVSTLHLYALSLANDRYDRVRSQIDQSLGTLLVRLVNLFFKNSVCKIWFGHIGYQ